MKVHYIDRGSSGSIRLELTINFTILATENSSGSMNAIELEQLRSDSRTLQSCLDPGTKEFHPDIVALGFEFTQFSQLEEQHTKDHLNLLDEDDVSAYDKSKTDIDAAGNKLKSAILPLAGSCFKDETCRGILKEYEKRATIA